MSEITSDYRLDDNVHRVKVIAKAAKLSGSGSITSYAWVIDENSLPAEMIDSDESTSEASNGPTIRASLDEYGSTQIGLDVQDFTPASGGAGGGATAEIWLDPSTYTGGTALPVWLWWITGGSQTQPAADATYGSESVYTGYEFASQDGGITDVTGNYTPTNNGSSAGTQFKIGAESRDFDGTNDDILVSITTDPTAYTLLAWVRPDAVTSRNIIVRTDSSGPTTSWSHQLRISSGSKAQHYLFDQGGPATRSVTGTTSLSTATWYQIIGTVANGDNMDLYLDGSSEGTPTAVTTLWTSGDRYKIAQNTGDSMSRYDGHIDHIAIIHAKLDSDQVSTLYENQNDPSAFWDSTAAVEDGPFGAVHKYEWTFYGRERTWTCAIVQSGYTSTTTTVQAGAEMRAVWGRRTNQFDDVVRAAEIYFDIVDPDLTIYNELTATTAEEGDFTFTATDSTGTYTMNFNIRLDETETLFITGLEQHITRIYGYCGMAEMVNRDAVTLTSSTMGNLMRLILVSSGLAQDIEFIWGHYPENVASTGVLLSLMRLNRLDLIFSDGTRKIDTMYEQLQGLLEGFGLTAINGIDGQWHVKHSYGIGETLTSKRGTMQYDYSANAFTTLNTISASIINVSTRYLGRDTMRRPIRAISSVQAERGNSRTFITIDLVKHGDFEEGWIDANTHETWETDSGGTFALTTSSDTGTYAGYLAASTGIARQYLARFAGGRQELDFEITGRYAIESTTAVTTTEHFYVGLTHFNRPFGFDAGLSTLSFGQPDGWTSVLSSFVFATTSVANGDSLVYSTFTTVARGPMPEEDGLLLLTLSGDLVGNGESGTDYNVFVDTVEVRIKNGDNAKNKFVSVSGRYDLDNNLLIKGGDVVEQKQAWWHGILGVDLDGNDTRDAVHPMIQALTTAAGSWVQASDWNSEVFGYNTTDYFDLFELSSQIRISQQDETTEQIDGEYAQIVPPTSALLYSSNYYLQVYTEIDFRREVSAFVANRKLQGYAQNLAESPPTVLYYLDSNKRVRSAPIDADSEPWTPTTLFSAGRTPTIIRVDKANNYAFVKESTNNVADYIKRYDLLTGDNGTDIVTYSWTTLDKLKDIQIDTVNQLVYALVGFGTPEAIDIYDYDGNLQDSITLTDNSSVGQLAFDGDYLMYQATTDKLYKVVISTQTETLVDNLSSPDNSQNSAAMDLTTGYYFYYHDSAGIRRTDAPDGQNETQIYNTAVDQSGLAIDKFNLLVYFGSTDRIVEIDYDGNNNRVVVDQQADTYDIRSIDLG